MLEPSGRCARMPSTRPCMMAWKRLVTAVPALTSCACWRHVSTPPPQYHPSSVATSTKHAAARHLPVSERHQLSVVIQRMS